MIYLLSGGFARGRRTYILGFLAAASAVAAWAMGDITLAQLIERLPEILTGLGLMTLRAATR